MNHTLKWGVALAALIAAASVLAQGASPYSGQETRDVKALSENQIAGLLAGKGMGYAKAAELNGFPGPLHVLELAEKLELSDEQRAQTEANFQQMQADAQRLGAELVAAERRLDALFAQGSADEASVTGLTDAIGATGAKLRAVHLHAHLRQTRILSAQQIAQYVSLRGYGHGGHGHHAPQHHGGHHGGHH